MIAENKFSAFQKEKRERNWKAKTNDTNRWDFFIRDYYANISKRILTLKADVSVSS